jgi:hypothetical protein
MADETKVKQLSDDEYNRMMHGSFAHEAIKSAMAQGEQAQQQNVQANAAPGIVQSQPAIPPKINLPKISKSVEPPVAGQPDANAVAQQVNKAITNLQISTPPPKPPSSADHLIDQISSNWQIPATVVGIGTAIAGVSYLMGRKGLKDRDISNRKEPTMGDIPEEWKGIVAKSEQNAAAKAAEAAAKTNPVPQNYTAGVPSIQKNVETSPTGAFTQQSGYKQPIPATSQPQPSQFDLSKLGESRDPLANRGFQYPVVPTAEPTTIAPTEKSTSKGPKKEPAVVTFKTAKDIPEGFVFRPDVGNLDRSLGNILGLEHRANAREMFAGGKPFGQFKGSGPTAFNDEISRLTTNYFQKLQSEIPETILSRDARKAQGIPSDFGTYATKTNFGKAAKVAGVAGTLIAVADLANAKTAEQKANAGVNLLEAVLPPGADILEAGKGSTLSAEQVQQRQNAYLLGSPYAQTEQAKLARLREKAGAGRGIAPPSAYMR